MCDKFNAFMSCCCVECVRARGALVMGSVQTAAQAIGRFVNTRRAGISHEEREDAGLAMCFLADLVGAREAQLDEEEAEAVKS